MNLAFLIFGSWKELLSEKTNKKNRKISYESNQSARTNYTENNKTKKKHVTFTKPVYSIIDVESYKKFNEDISETRYYYVPENTFRENDYGEASCGCNVF